MTRTTIKIPDKYRDLIYFIDFDIFYNIPEKNLIYSFESKTIIKKFLGKKLKNLESFYERYLKKE